MRSQTLEAEGSASRNHSSKGGGNTSSDTSDSRSSKPTPGRETGPDQDLLSRLQNLVIESEHPEVQVLSMTYPVDCALTTRLPQWE